MVKETFVAQTVMSIDDLKNNLKGPVTDITALRTKIESIPIKPRVVTIKSQGIGSAFIIGHPENGIVGGSTTLGVGGKDAQTTTSVVPFNNVYKDFFYTDDFVDSSNTTATVDTSALTVSFGDGEVLQSSSIHKNNGTITKATLVTVGNLTGTGNLTYELSADGGLSSDVTTTYSFPDIVTAEVGWDYAGTTDEGFTTLQVKDTDGAWCWTDSGSISTLTGPPTGTDCVYTETSSPVTANDEFTMTLSDSLDASANDYSITFDTCTRGDATAELHFEAFNGSTWDSVDSWNGDGVTTFTSRGSYDLSSYSNSDLKVRFRVVVANTNTFNSDMAITNVIITYAGNSSWETVTLNSEHTFTNTGTDLLYKITSAGSNTINILSSEVYTPLRVNITT